jgi:hypothetical protein
MPDMALDELKARLEKILDAWLGEKMALYVLRHFFIVLTCFVIGTVLLRVFGILRLGRQHSPVERRSQASGGRETGVGEK